MVEVKVFFLYCIFLEAYYDNISYHTHSKHMSVLFWKVYSEVQDNFKSTELKIILHSARFTRPKLLALQLVQNYLKPLQNAKKTHGIKFATRN